MIQVFRKNWFVFTLLLLPYAVITRSWIFFGETATNRPDMPYSQTFEALNNVFPESNLWNVLLACVIVFLNAALINHIVIRNRIAREINLFPGMVYILLTALHKDMFWLSPMLVGQFFLLIGVANAFRIYQKPIAGIYLFNTGFFTAIAGLIFVPYTLFLIFGVLAILSLRKLGWRDIMQLITGYVLVFFFLAVIRFWQEVNPNPFLDLITLIEWKLGFTPYQVNEWIIFLIIAILTITGVINYRKFTIKKSIQSQKKINLIYWFLFLGFLTLPFHSTDAIFAGLIPVFFPFAVFIGMIMTRTRNEAAMEILHVFILFFVLFSHFWY